MGWPYYEFLSLSSDEKHARRLAIDKHASYAQFSVLIPVLAILIYRAAVWAVVASGGKRGAYKAIPSSPTVKTRRQSGYGAWVAQLRKVEWWLGEDVRLFGQSWGERDLFVFGGLWAMWLIFLCMREVGYDYLHLTKRFGAIASSQLPIQYLLALKSLNPFAFAFRSSHEHINRWHRVLGGIIYFLLCLHGSFYLYYFAQNSILLAKLSGRIQILGVAAFASMSLLNATALRLVRQFSYRLFFITHLAVAFAVPALLCFHARNASPFAIEAVLVFIADLASRKLDTVVAPATVEIVPGSADLVKISAPVPPTKATRFRANPGAHIYLNVPAAARPSRSPVSPTYLLFEFLFNPFTVAAVDDETSHVTLVARRRNGPMTRALARLARGAAAKSSSNEPDGDSDNVPLVDEEKSKVPLALEGPYGAAAHFPRLAGGEFDRVLLVAGGVGATFTVPLYRAVAHENPQVKVEMVWAVRTAGDAAWAAATSAAAASPANGAGAPVPYSILDDENVHIFLTGDDLETSLGEGDDDDGVELSALDAKYRRRPDLKKIVDDMFKHGREERIAVLVCGPEAMGREMRHHVGAWVMRGRSVWWHNETFSW